MGKKTKKSRLWKPMWLSMNSWGHNHRGSPPDRYEEYFRSVSAKNAKNGIGGIEGQRPRIEVGSKSSDSRPLRAAHALDSALKWGFLGCGKFAD